jgi:hypothetical protein
MVSHDPSLLPSSVRLVAVGDCLCLRLAESLPHHVQVGKDIKILAQGQPFNNTWVNCNISLT